MSTIFALSSGAPPAAIAVLRLSGPAAFATVRALTRRDLPGPRLAVLRALHDPATGDLLDRGLVLVFAGPHSATGEDLVELHLHGGRAVTRAVEGSLKALPTLRPAEPGEFTRRALLAGRIDLTQAEALADLLEAETEHQRCAALAGSEGGLRRMVEDWSRRTVALAASVEAVIDHGDDEDLGEQSLLIAEVYRDTAVLAAEIDDVLARPPVERLKDGIHVVLAGPPNSGKSSLANALVERELSIVSPVAGTTRDLVEASVMRGGVAWRFTDTAGLTETTNDPIEAIGVERATKALVAADIILWLGDEQPARDDRIIAIHARADDPSRDVAPSDRLPVSARVGSGMSELWRLLESRASSLMPRSAEVLLNERQRGLAALASARLSDVVSQSDELLVAEMLSAARSAFDRLTGRADTEALLDEIFGRFCIGK